MLLVATSISTKISAGITCGSQNAGFKVTGGAQLAAGSNGLSLSDGTIRTTSTHATSITGSLTCSNTVIQIDDTADDRLVELQMDGTYAMATGAITLGINETLKLTGGTTESTVTVNGTSDDPSIIEGSGALGGDVTIGVSKQLNLDMQSALNVNLQSVDGTGTVKLLDDLVFEDGKSFTTIGSACAALNCNNHKWETGSQDLTQSAITIHDASVELNGKLTLGGTLTLGTSAGVINGNGNALDLNSNTIDMNSFDLTLVNINLAQFASGSLANSASNDLYLSDVSITGANGSVRVHGVGAAAGGVNSLPKVTVAATSSFFGDAAVTFDNEVALDLLKPVTLGTTWDFDSTVYINGNSHAINMASGIFNLGGTTNQIYLSNITLEDMAASSLANPGDLYCNNVTFNGANGEAVISGNGGDYAQVSVTDGDIFGNNVTFDASNGAVIELKKDSTIATGKAWTFADDTTIIGNGNILTLTGGLVINAGVTVYFRDVIVKGWTGSTASAGDGQIHFVNATTSDAYFSDATVILGGNITFSQGDIHVTGPTTFVTGGNSFTTSADGDLYVDNVTLWYDTMAESDTANISPKTHDGALVHITNSGAIKAIGSTSVQELSYPNANKPYLTKSHDLYAASEYDATGDESETGDVASAVDITFKVGDGTISGYDDAVYAFDGNGRALNFHNYTGESGDSAVLCTVEDTVDVTVKHVLLNGLKDGNIQMGTSSDDAAANSCVLTFGDGVTVRLQESDTLTKTYTFGTASADAMTLDLNGHELDLGTGKILVSNGTLTVKNGRITGLTGTSGSENITGGSNPTTTNIIFEDVELALAANTDFTASTGNLQFTGDCKVTGLEDAVFHFNAAASTATATQSLTVNVNSMLTIDTALELKITTTEHAVAVADQQVSHLQLASGASAGSDGTLNLHGGKLTAAGVGELVICEGRLVADHRARLDAGTNGIRIGADSLADADWGASGAKDLTIELMPGALLNITNGTVTYDNATA